MDIQEQESSGTRSYRRPDSARKKLAANREDRKDGRSSRLKRVRPEERSLNNYVLCQTYVLMAVTGLGYLALLWSTVVLLGGFVTVLRRKDFWCLTSISMLQASRIFNDFEDILWLNACEWCARIIQDLRKKVDAKELPWYCYVAFSWGFILCLPAIFVIMGLVFLLELVYVYGHLVCVGLSSWRIVQRDYGSNDGDGSKANLMPALDIFYSLVLCRGAFLFVWGWLHHGGMWPVVFLRRACKFPEKWGSRSVSEYFMDTRAKCWRDPASIHGRKLIHYAVDLLGSESQQDYLSGARMLDTFIKLEADVRSLLLTSRPKIQKLIDTLGWRSSDREIRELAARIVAYLAGDIHLTQYPGAIQCISSLLDTSLPYWKNNQQGHNHCSTQNKSEMPINAKERLIYYVRNIEECRAKRIELRSKKGKTQEGDGQQDEADIPIYGSKEDGWNELILQGMAILEKLTADQHNCSEICSTPGLLPKIMTPLHSQTLIQDISINAWADIVNGSLKVVHRLIRVPEWTGGRVHSEISSSKHALSNLEEILDEGNGNVVELQMRAMEILTELALDMQTDLSSKTKENLIKKQLQIFLTDGEPEEHDTKFVPKRLKVTAGKTLALLSKTATTSALVGREYENIVELLDAKNKIIYRTIAAEILENLFSHHQMDKEHLKTILLPKLLSEVLNSQREPPTEASQSNVSAPGDDAEHQQLSVLGNDEEKQLSEHKSQIKSTDQANEERTAMMELQEAFLSLTLVICSELISADDFNTVALMIVPAEGEFVAKLKTIVEENCEATANSLRIVKLCGQIALTMMRRGQYSAHFKDQKFVEALSKASTIMSNLESCMLFAGTDCGAKKTVRPLLSGLVKEAQALAA